MSIKVTLHIFSGRPDPVWELSGEQAEELTRRLAKITTATLQKPAGLMGGLGYRGFSLMSEHNREDKSHIYIHAGTIDKNRFKANEITNTSELEEWLLDTAGNVISDEVRHAVKNKIGGKHIIPLMSVPAYNPEKWNSDPNIQARNNCYNYANDIITNTFAQPGFGGGRKFSFLTCEDVGLAAQLDRQIPVDSTRPNPAEGHFIALVIWPEIDFHWYRLDSNGMWSQKDGVSPAQNVDNSGELISDPRTCDRGDYTSFCGFYHCIPSKVKIK